jgi:uncharacterized membrane protein YbhN (UPF0104 family)
MAGRSFLSAIAFGVATGAVLLVGATAGYGHLVDALSDVRPAWVVLAALLQIVAVAAYAIAFHWAVGVDGGPRLSWRSTFSIVLTGFGAHAPAGGFGVDQQALRKVTDRRRAMHRVLGLGALEYAILAPAATICAVVMLLDHDRVDGGLLWPWILCVPIGFGIGLWLSRPGNDTRLRRGPLWLRMWVDHGLEGVRTLHRLVSCGDERTAAYAAIAAYWAADIASLYAALRAVGVQLDAPSVILAYATGYAATRRTLPLGGAGVTEVLMTYALHWVGAPLAPALAGVVVYRAFNLVAPAVPALLAHRHAVSRVRTLAPLARWR